MSAPLTTIPALATDLVHTLALGATKSGLGLPIKIGDASPTLPINQSAVANPKKPLSGGFESLAEFKAVMY